MQPARDRAATAEPAPFSDRPALLLVAGVVLMAMVEMLYLAPAHRLRLELLASAYLLLFVVGWPWVERRARPLPLWGLLAALTTLAALMMWASSLNNLLLFMPLISLFVLHLGLRWTVALTVAMVAEAQWLAARLGLPPRSRAMLLVDYLTAAAFVITFSQLLLRERRARQQLRRYAAQVEQLATSNERNRIAREIHDSVGHYLTVVHVQIEAARAILGANRAGADECLGRAEDLVRDGLAELRRSVTLLRGGAVAERPFGVALAALVDESRAGGLATTLTLEGQPRTLPPAIEFTLYRAAQEGLTNVKRHAQASAARLVLRYDEHEVRLRVEDDGVGTTAAAGGFGLTGLRERAQLVGGTVAVHSGAGTGFTLELTVPT